ncbi:thioredoxin family protein [Falsihalocynthiibacter sp. SS001]|uniref:thioredoxin family protein n=1 Tax=Falsihalocynthiibacter sp. SS001 TaxID=3349698 RepID=UPI0036D26F18
MDRRLFIGSAIAISAFPLTASASSGSVAYVPGLVDKALADGKTVFIDFATDWCTTCAAQNRVIQKLRSENPAYDAGITFVYFDWDQYSKDELARRLKIPRRSVLVALKGDAEIGRVTLGTSEKEIKALMDAALNA